jgi:biopolymer transport protein ExbD
MAFSSGGGGNDNVMASINTTPLIDVMLVLLIIFMITAPLLAHKVQVPLPNNANVPNEEKPDTVTIAMTEDGKLYWNDVEVDIRRVEYQFAIEARKALEKGRPQPEIQIRAAKQLPYGRVRELMVVAKRQGIVKLGFITTPGRS